MAVDDGMDEITNEDFSIGDDSIVADDITQGDFDDVGDVDDDSGGEGIEERGRKVLAEVQAGTKRLRKSEAGYAATMADDYWFAVYFPTADQKRAFLEAMKWQQFGETYLRGLSLPRPRDKVIPATPKPSNPAKKIDGRLADLAMGLDSEELF